MTETKKIKPNLITFDVYSALVDYSSGYTRNNKKIE